MKCYEVIFERDGFSVKAPGVTETEIRRESIYYAAVSMESVWGALEDLINDPERTLISIAELLPMIVVVSDEVTK